MTSGCVLDWQQRDAPARALGGSVQSLKCHTCRAFTDLKQSVQGSIDDAADDLQQVGMQVTGTTGTC